MNREYHEREGFISEANVRCSLREGLSNHVILHNQKLFATLELPLHEAQEALRRPGQHLSLHP